MSRGLVRSEPVGDGARAKRYRAEDVRSLKNRRAPLVESQGLKSADLPVMDSAVSTITEEGPIYRGVHATALAETATLEQTATLLWDAKSADPFAKSNMPVVSPAMRAILEAAKDAPFLDRAVAVLSQATEADPRAYNAASEGRAATGARIVRLVAAAILQVEPSADPLHKQVARAWAPKHKHADDLIRRALVLLADHELNASTFTVRCAVSTGISLYDAMIAGGLVALKGPRHGGVGPMASRLVDTLLEGRCRRDRARALWRWANAFRASATWSIATAIRARRRCLQRSSRPGSTGGSRSMCRSASARQPVRFPIAITRSQ